MQLLAKEIQQYVYRKVSAYRRRNCKIHKRRNCKDCKNYRIYKCISGVGIEAAGNVIGSIIVVNDMIYLCSFRGVVAWETFELNNPGTDVDTLISRLIEMVTERRKLI